MAVMLMITFSNYLNIELKFIILFVFLLFYILCLQIPYIVGQNRLHDELLLNCIGTEREDLLEKLLKYTPILPKFHIFKSIIIGSVTGGFFIFLIKELLKKLLI